MSNERLSPHFIERQLSLREQIGSSLRAALITGEMKPGETYSVPGLAEKFGISGTPVREAVLDLTKEGILVVVPNKGFRVVEISADTLSQLTEIRLILEIPVTVKIAAMITHDEIEGLRGIALAIQKHAKKQDLINFIEADRQFHNGILKLSGNPLLAEFADQLRSRARIYALPFIVATGQLETSASEHLVILDAMGKRDFATVERVLVHHINYTIDAIQATDTGKIGASGPLSRIKE
jgi:DNA-binding GntR family transcriptional regulator